MLGFRSQWVCVLVLSAWVALGSRASAQERLDSSVRAWADVDFYSGDLLFEGTTVTSVTPVLRGEVELSSLQLGLDLPLALGITSYDSDLLGGASVDASGTGLRFGNPTLHADYVLEDKPTRGAIGLALAIRPRAATGPANQWTTWPPMPVPPPVCSAAGCGTAGGTSRTPGAWSSP